MITRIRVREESGTLIKWKKNQKLQKDIRYSGQNPRTEDIKRINIVSGNTTFSLYRYRYCFRKDLLLQNTGICTKSGKCCIF